MNNKLETAEQTVETETMYLSTLLYSWDNNNKENNTLTAAKILFLIIQPKSPSPWDYKKNNRNKLLVAIHWIIEVVCANYLKNILI